MNPNVPITVHMMVKNEDQWVRYSLLSILPYVETILVTDTGSTDHTIEAIKSLNSPKIILTQTPVTQPSDVTKVRNTQLVETKTPWFWVVDGDEIYPEETTIEVVRAITSDKYEGVTVRRYDLLGDIYHRQIESVGSYSMWGEVGHLVLRALNKNKIKGLCLKGDYPLEGYYDEQGVAVIDRDRQNHYITTSYLYHAMYLKRSSLGGNLPMINRGKYRVESGIPVTTKPPAVFSKFKPLVWEGDPLAKKSPLYNLAASLITPIKNLKRSL